MNNITHDLSPGSNNVLNQGEINILIGGEESQAICLAFRELGFNAFSCDMKDCSGGHPEWHYKMNYNNLLNKDWWNLIILHPECTKVACSGNGTYAKGKPKYNERIEAAKEIEGLWFKCIDICDFVCFENPQGVLPGLTKLPKPQYVQPWQFGHTEQKKTGLWLHNLPPLKETDNVYDKMMKLHIKYRQKTWWTPPGKKRAEIRSKTYPGIAKAMAEQWSFIFNGFEKAKAGRAILNCGQTELNFD